MWDKLLSLTQEAVQEMCLGLFDDYAFWGFECFSCRVISFKTLGKGLSLGYDIDIKLEVLMKLAIVCSV